MPGSKSKDAQKQMQPLPSDAAIVIWVRTLDCQETKVALLQQPSELSAVRYYHQPQQPPGKETMDSVSDVEYRAITCRHCRLAHSVHSNSSTRVISRAPMYGLEASLGTDSPHANEHPIRNSP
ncbi:hypothetical protein PCANC_10857 [Puccinia coronata f. sp. avenae]|uniref:Uncharacterized protein n=1 Tax=Puccinia coronata f. sp. avenae TaxID=200324 RepID=A0A2N5SZS6_9BASI|nr:hypothetical protein PCANC_12573 [Puccinia coronata f. sp. avenae]PLW43644.1 hypothetical protein PCANC_10857 [Puccinia coronata f. sp. avenae]